MPSQPPSVWTKIKWNDIHWTNTLFLILTPLIAAVAVPIYLAQHGLSWQLTLFFLVSYAMTNMSITCGYHRYLSHRSYDAHPLIRFLYVMVGAAAFQGSALAWCTDHRRHHLRVDTDEDPYSINKGFWYAHIGWLLHKENSKYAGKFAPDLAKSKLLQWQHKYYPWIATAMGFGVPALLGWAMGFGWGGLIIGGFLRVVLTQHSTFFINSFCHLIGRQPYSDKHTARDSFIMAVLTFGEGYHNFHHEFQIDYRNGIRWYHWDPTKWWIKFLALVGLAHRLRQVSHVEILKVRLQMDERRLLAHGACAEKVVALKSKVEEAQIRMRNLREEYLRLKASMQQQSRERYQNMRERYIQLRYELKVAKLEFKAAHQQWMMYAQSLQPIRA